MGAPTITRDRVEALVRATLSLHDASLRSHYVATTARSWPIETLARALDCLCERAERAEAPAREVLVAVVDALNEHEMAEVVQRLREEAVGASLLALERLIRHPSRAVSVGPSEERSRSCDDVVRADGGGRSLTLGQRKWLSRRPDRHVIEQLLRDPHPVVVAGCLQNPRATEEDVLRLVAHRPGRSDVLAEVARSRWVHRPRVRLALVLNRATPIEIAVRISGLLTRPELELVAGSTGAAPALRAVCLEHLERRPPFKRHARTSVSTRTPSRPNLH
ncbi:MAG TPA: hypothetical protein VEK07_18625 [Polyangiaceae bacterium]|nr:hypothetical protein [Polyangiaceae bacterium]